MKLKGQHIPYFIILILLSLGHHAQAQFRVVQIMEFGWWGGTTHYIGDIKMDMSSRLENSKLAGGVYTRLNLDPRLSLKAFFNKGEVSGNDLYSPSAALQARNLHFKSPITEIGLQFEFNFYKYLLGDTKYFFSPYIFLGMSWFTFNPQAFYQGSWVELQGLGTEGQLSPTGAGVYKKNALAVPIGMGFKYNVKSNLSMGIEIGYRATSTDFLDDVSGFYPDATIFALQNNGDLAAALSDPSLVGPNDLSYGALAGKQRGSNREMDAFIFSQFSISYTFTKNKCPWPSK